MQPEDGEGHVKDVRNGAIVVDGEFGGDGGQANGGVHAGVHETGTGAAGKKSSTISEHVTEAKNGIRNDAPYLSPPSPVLPASLLASSGGTSNPAPDSDINHSTKPSAAPVGEGADGGGGGGAGVGGLPFSIPVASSTLSSVELQETPTKEYSAEELAHYTGMGEDKTILLAINGKVFDVTSGSAFYGPGGAYEKFGGRDATSGLCKFQLRPTYDPVDIKSLTPIQQHSLENWEKFYSTKYKWVGLLVRTEAELKAIVTVNPRNKRRGSYKTGWSKKEAGLSKLCCLL